MSYSEIKASYPKARKEYCCEWCNQKILIGEKHFSRAYKFYSEFQYGRMHLECQSAMEKSDHGVLSDGWSEGDMERGVPAR